MVVHAANSKHTDGFDQDATQLKISEADFNLYMDGLITSRVNAALDSRMAWSDAHFIDRISRLSETRIKWARIKSEWSD